MTIDILHAQPRVPSSLGLLALGATNPSRPTRLFPGNTWAFARLAGRPRLLGAARGAAFALFSFSELGCGEKWMMCALPACCERGAATLAGESITGVTVFFGFCVSREVLSIACARARGGQQMLQVRRRPGL
jgi:hypothetical protein